MSKWSFVLFLAIALSVYAAMHGFVYWRLASGLALTAGQRTFLKLLLAAGALSFIAGEFLSRVVANRALLCAGSVWLGILAISLAVFLVEMVLSLLIPQQRRLLVLAALFLVFLVSAFSVVNAALGPVSRERRIVIPGLAPQMDGFTIVQLSDLHVGNLTSMRRLRRIVEQANAMKPDLVCVTGDTLDGEVGRDGRYCEVLGGLRARHGVAAITGNHEFYAGIDKFMELARCSHWRVLRNESWVIAGKLAVIGLDDDTAVRMGLPGPDLDAALRPLAAGIPKVLLYHQPLKFAAAAERGIALQLSGHTHAGQIPPMDLLVRLTYEFPAGLYRRGGSYIHTSPGTSTWGPPMRFLSRSEITRLVLVAAKREGAPGSETPAQEGK
jgi:predicted MPP superfamily phosphohydrolase